MNPVALSPRAGGWQNGAALRGRAILDFNQRVLAQARRQDVPLLERLRYVTIVSSNLDEFFEVRMAELANAAADGGSGASNELLQTPAARRGGPAAAQRRAAAAQALAGVWAQAHALIDAQYALLNAHIMPALQAQGIEVLNHAQRNAAQRAWVARYFARQVRPVLVPLTLDPAQAFPVVENKSLHFIVRLAPPGAYRTRRRDQPAGQLVREGEDERGGDGDSDGESDIAIVKVPRVLPRVIRLPDALCAPRQCFVLLTSVIRAHLAQLFPRREVLAFSQFRVTRDSELEVDEDDFSQLRQSLRRGLRTRQYGQAIRLEVVQSCPPALSALLCARFKLPPQALFRVNGPVNLVRLNQLIDQATADGLRFAPFEPRRPLAQRPVQEPLFNTLRRTDLLLHHPFESFEPVLRFLREAVRDPQVLAIRQTIYRTGSESALMELLMEAARMGKAVTVVVELKARFDEEVNINWAERLEAVGAQVVYGIPGLKTHAKMLLVTRREGPRLRRYLHLSTGNYNVATARLYTDLGYLSADPALCAEAEALFQWLANQRPLPRAQRLVVAPFSLHRRWLGHLRQVARAAQTGLPARVVVKVNGLTDPAVMAALQRAAQAGARIDLIVRGACLLLPQTGSKGGWIRVRSVVGRFLEHSRIFYFRWGESDADEALYLSSADWMTRNLHQRVEVAWGLPEAAMRQRVIDEALVPYLHDTRDAWAMGADGVYRPLAPAPRKGRRSKAVSAQGALLRLLGESAR